MTDVDNDLISLLAPTEVVADGYEPPTVTPRRFDRAAEAVRQALDEVREELADKRALRESLRREIRLLVAEEDRLRRMERLTQDVVAEGGGDEPF